MSFFIISIISEEQLARSETSTSFRRSFATLPEVFFLNKSIIPTSTTGRPPKELRKFVKVKLEPGEEKQVEFTLTAQDLSYYDETLGSWYAAPGEYKILLGHSSRDIHATLSVRFSTPRRRPFVIDENTTIGELSKDDRTAAIIQQVLAQAGNALTGGNAGGSEIASSEAVAQMLDSMPLRGIVNFGGPAAAGMITPLLEILRAAIQ